MTWRPRCWRSIPVPWARAQMAFTLAAHIILVPLGVSWAFMTLIANYRAIKKDDRDALLLAQRWSKYMAVTFAVGAVTGTVLSFEFGLLWPKFMGQWGDAFGIPFAIEGLFFFTEAIFIAIYIYGWHRLKPWPHFWTGVPIVITGIGGTVSVVAANAWMNEPAGFTLNSAGKVVDVDPWGVIFNEAMPLRSRAHARRRVPGRRLPGRVGVRGRDAARPQRPVSPARVHHPVHRRRDRDAGADVRRRHAGPLGVRERADQVRGHRARAEDVERRARDAVRAPERGRDRERRHPDPRASRRSSRTRRRGRARSSRAATPSPIEDQPTIAQANTVHLAWDVMVGLGTLLFLLSVWYGLSWLFRRDIPKIEVVPPHRRVRRRPVGHRDGGGMGRHRGRPPTVDRVRLHEGRGRRDDEHGRVGRRSS